MPVQDTQSVWIEYKLLFENIEAATSIQAIEKLRKKADDLDIERLSTDLTFVRDLRGLLLDGLRSRERVVVLQSRTTQGGSVARSDRSKRAGRTGRSGSVERGAQPDWYVETRRSLATVELCSRILAHSETDRIEPRWKVTKLAPWTVERIAELRAAADELERGLERTNHPSGASEDASRVLLEAVKTALTIGESLSRPD